MRDGIEESVQASRMLKQSLEEAGVRGVDLWWKDMEDVHGIRENVPEYEKQFPSFQLEGVCALDLRIGGFDVQMKPYGTKGPDLQISSEGLCMDIEVSSFVKDEDAEKEMSEGGKVVGIADASTDMPLSPWEVSRMRNEGIFHDKMEKGEIYEIKGLGNMPEKSHKIDRKIREKAEQLCDDVDGIVLLYSNDIYTDKIEFKRLKDEWTAGEIRAPEEIPENLAAVIFGDGSRAYGQSRAKPKSLISPRSRMPADELERVMRKIMCCLS